MRLFDGPRYPEICPKIMLKCGGSTTMAPVFDPDLKPFFFRAPGPFDVHGGSDAAEPMHNSLQNIFGHPRRLRHHHWDMEGEDLEQMLKEKPMPPNPVADCQPETCQKLAFGTGLCPRMRRASRSCTRPEGPLKLAHFM